MDSSGTRRRGRPNKYKQFDEMLAGCPVSMRRPRYVDRIGVRRGQRGDTIWVKIHASTSINYRGRSYPAGSSIEIKLGRLSSFPWEQAIVRRDELQRRADVGEPLEDQVAETFAMRAKDWLERKRTTVKRPDTLKVHVDVHLEPEFGSLRLDEITPSRIEKWIARACDSGLTDGYVKRILNTLRSILNDAVRDGVLDENPTARISVRLQAAARSRFLEAHEIVRLLEAAREVDPWCENMIVFALHSGMRRGEMQAMRWTDVRTIEAQIDDKPIQIIQIDNSKSGQPRSVVCTPAMSEALQKQRQHRVAGDERVFPVSAMTWRRRWEECRHRAGLGDIRLHDLRRTSATIAAASGVPLRTLAERLGHTNLRMLEQHYAMVSGSAEVSAAESIQAGFEHSGTNIVPLHASQTEEAGRIAKAIEAEGK